MGVARIFGLNFSGFFAWWMWRTVYLSKLPGLDKKVRVAFDWTLDLLFPKDVCAIYEHDQRPDSHRLDPAMNPAGNNGHSPPGMRQSAPSNTGIGLTRIEPLPAERYGWANPEVG